MVKSQETQKRKMKKIFEKGGRKIIIVIASFAVLVGGMFFWGEENDPRELSASVYGLNGNVTFELWADDYAEVFINGIFVTSVGDKTTGNACIADDPSYHSPTPQASAVVALDASQVTNISVFVQDTCGSVSGAALRFRDSTDKTYCFRPDGYALEAPAIGWANVVENVAPNSSCWVNLTSEMNTPAPRTHKVPSASYEISQKFGTVRFSGLVTANGSPVQGIEVTIWDVNASHVRTSSPHDRGTTRSDGKIVFSDLHPGSSNPQDGFLYQMNNETLNYYGTSVYSSSDTLLTCPDFSKSLWNDNVYWEILFHDPSGTYNDKTIFFDDYNIWNAGTDIANVVWTADLTAGPGSPALNPSPQNIVVGQTPQNMTASGGTSPYTFSFSAGGTGITGCSGTSCTFSHAATHTGAATATVTDSLGKTGTATITVSDSSGNPTLTPSTQSIHPGATPGSITFSGAEGVTYTFTFTDGGTGVAKASGCTNGEKTSDTCTFSAASASAANGSSATLSVSGSDGKTASATISVATTALTLAPDQTITAGDTPGILTVSGGEAGSRYTFTLTDNGTGITKNSCNGGTTTTCSLNASTSPGTLIVKVDDTVGGGSAEATITVQGTSLTLAPDQTITAGDTPGILTVSGGGAGSQYTFTLTDNGTGITKNSCSGGTTTTCSLNASISPGDLIVKVEDTVGKGTAEATITVEAGEIFLDPPYQEPIIDTVPPIDVIASGGTGYTFTYDDGGTGMIMTGCDSGSAGLQTCSFTDPTAVGTATLTATDLGCPLTRKTATLKVLPRPNTLTITKVADVVEVIAGDSVVYTITYGNTGSAPYNTVTITDDYDESLLDITSVPGGCSNSGGILTCNIGVLAGGATGTITYTAKAKDIPAK